MRTRIRSQAQHLTGRRRHVARRRRMPSSCCGSSTRSATARRPGCSARADARGGRRRRARALRRAQGRARKALAGYAERMKTDALKRAGIATDSLVNDQTPEVDPGRARREPEAAALPAAASSPARPSAKGKFEIHTREDDFNTGGQDADRGQAADDQGRARRRLRQGRRLLRPRQRASIHVRSRTKFGHAVHEAMHRVAHPGFHGFWGEFINEGVTQTSRTACCASRTCRSSPTTSTSKQLACAKKLVDGVELRDRRAPPTS